MCASSPIVSHPLHTRPLGVGHRITIPRRRIRQTRRDRNGVHAAKSTGTPCPAGRHLFVSRGAGGSLRNVAKHAKASRVVVRFGAMRSLTAHVDFRLRRGVLSPPREKELRRPWIRRRPRNVCGSSEAACRFALVRIAGPICLFESHSQRSCLKKPRLLLADDHTMVLEGFRRLLEPEYDLVGAREKW